MQIIFPNPLWKPRINIDQFKFDSRREAASKAARQHCQPEQGSKAAFRRGNFSLPLAIVPSKWFEWFEKGSVI